MRKNWTPKMDGLLVGIALEDFRQVHGAWKENEKKGTKRNVFISCAKRNIYIAVKRNKRRVKGDKLRYAHQMLITSKSRKK